MAAGYDCDVTRPAASASEATRWTYLAYLAAVKSNDGAAISLGRLDASSTCTSNATFDPARFDPRLRRRN